MFNKAAGKKRFHQKILDHAGIDKEQPAVTTETTPTSLKRTNTSENLEHQKKTAKHT